MTTLFASRLDVIKRLTGDHGGKLVPLCWWAQALAALDDQLTREVVLWLKRQQGKSTFVGGAAASTILTKPNSYVLLVAGSEKQQRAIYGRKLRRPLERLMKARKLDDLARFTDNGIEIPALNSALEVIAPNSATVPGRSVTELYLDECRSIPDDVFITLAPSVIGTGGKLILASTAGRPAGFFYEICQHPSPETLLIHATESNNPHASKSVLDYLKRRLGLLSPAAVAREIENQFAEDGQPFLSPDLIEAAVDPYVTESWSETAECVGFADLSRKRDLSSVVIVTRHASRRPEVADHLRVVSVKVWDPKRDTTGEVDFREVRAHLAALPRRFPHLRTLLIDGGAEGRERLPVLPGASAPDHGGAGVHGDPRQQPRAVVGAQGSPGSRDALDPPARAFGAGVESAAPGIDPLRAVVADRGQHQAPPPRRVAVAGGSLLRGVSRA